MELAGRSGALAAQSVRAYAEAADARVFFLRTQQGRHEIDLIVEGAYGAVVPIEVKLPPSSRPRTSATCCGSRTSLAHG